MAAHRTRRDLASLLSRSLGEQVARAQVDQTCDLLGFRGAELTLEQALQVLEQLTKQPGLVGVAARFSKARIHLAWESEP